MKYIVTCSGGNDSIALIQYMQENHKSEYCVLYNDTGWARKDWPERIAKVAAMCFDLGVAFHITKSIGMEGVVRKNKGWPMPASAMQWCTMHLKEKPSQEFYQKIDPTILSLTINGEASDAEASPDNIDWYKRKLTEKGKDKKLKNKCELSVLSGANLTVVTGRRREESDNRKDLALWQYESIKHGGRDVYNPLINFDEAERDVYIRRFGLEPLPHQSKECYPCVCANKGDLSDMPLDDPRIDLIEKIEIDLGFTRNGKPRVMFRPYRVGGGVGIRQAIAWGRGERGFKSSYIPNEYKFKGEQCEMFESVSDVAYEIETKAGKEFARQCDGGYCGN